ILALWQVYLDQGMFALFWLIIIVAACDSGAYFIGKLMGKTPFSPTSPNKTLEGVIGGLICASVIGTILGVFVYSFWLSLFCSFFVAIFAVIGDLLESYFKREAGVKDSGDLIPGHGGVLDRIDAVIIAAFVMVALL
ncbi:phosphatidate cytidylyltransferase, partial [Campylobacter jejuni]